MVDVSKVPLLENCNSCYWYLVNGMWTIKIAVPLLENCNSCYWYLVNGMWIIKIAVCYVLKHYSLPFCKY
jgi:hypothetical protein